MYDSGTAMSGLACFVTADLARDLANDVMTLQSLSKSSEPDENKPLWRQLNKTALVHLQTSCLTSPFQTSSSSTLPSEMPHSSPLQNAPIPEILALCKALRMSEPSQHSYRNLLGLHCSEAYGTDLATDYLPSENDDKIDIVASHHSKCDMKSAQGNKAFAQAVPSADLPPVFQAAEVTCHVSITIPKNGVQSASVNVICELARKNPKNYLSLAPVFFKLMTSSTNNWMLIKIIKLFGALTPLEPRLGKKLIEPLTNLIHSTSAMSLLYECINTVIAGMPNHSASIQLCVQKLRILIEDSDQNLKYLGLLAMSKILKTHPRSVQAHKDLVLQCLDDKDESIRLRALDLLYGMVSKKNLMEIVKKLMVHMDRAEGTTYRDELLSKIIDICSQNNYQYITNFEWYVSVLVELTRIEGTKHGLTIASQMLDVAVRVQAVRAFSVSQMAVLLDNTHLLMGSGQRNSICEVLYAAAWICGEYSELLPEPHSTLEALVRPRASQLPPHIQSTYVHNALKLWARLVAAADRGQQEDDHPDDYCSQLLLEHLPLFVQSGDLEVQERACCALNLVKQVSKMHARGEQVSDELLALFSESSSEEEENTTEIFIKSDKSAAVSRFSEKKYEPSKEELESMREARRQEQASNPHYLKAMPKSRSTNGHLQGATMDDIPVTEIDLSVPLHIPGLISSDKYLSASRKEQGMTHGSKDRLKKPLASESEEELPAPLGVVNTSAEMPEGARLTDNDDEERNADDPHRALDIDLEEPLQEEERLPTQAHHDDLLAGVVAAGTKKEGVVPKAQDFQTFECIFQASLKTGVRHLLCLPLEHKHRKAHRDHKRSLEAATKAPAEVDSGAKQDDLDFWLSPSEGQDRPAAGGDLAMDSVLQTDMNGAAPVPKSERRKKHHDSEASGSKKKKKAKTATLLQQDVPKDKREYEEAPGITTPSKEPSFSATQTPMTPSMPPLLAEDKNIKLTYEVRTLPMVRDQVLVSVIFTNLSLYQLKEMELNILDTLNTKMLRRAASPHEGISVPFQLPKGTANEGQFAFTVDSVSMSQRLRGTLTYMVMTETGSTHEKLDLKLHLPVSSYLIGTMSKRQVVSATLRAFKDSAHVPLSRDTFAELLSGGELSAKGSITLEAIEYEFPHVLSKVCFHCHFTVVEQVGLSASLYSRSIQDDHICLLIKHMNPSRVFVDGKSTNQQLLSSLLEELRSLLCTAGTSI
ncbi:hypothetical protein MRX96_018389 [Rhipicephalus microplus]